MPATLDDAIDAFNGNKSISTALNLIRTARAYWLDDMIGDEEFDGWLLAALSVIETLS